jgi:hypothetical protein
MGQSRNMQCNTACPAKGHVRFTPKSDIKCDIGNVRQARSGHVGVGTNYQNSDQKNQDQVNLYGIAGLTNIFYKTYQRIPKRLRPGAAAQWCQGSSITTNSRAK